MKKVLKTLLVAALAAMLVVSMASCGKDGESSTSENTSSGEKQTLKIGCLALTEPCANFIKEVLEEDGYQVEVVMFDANNLPATALKDGDIDGMIGNHLPWLKTFNEENNCQLEMVEPYYYYSPFALYSSKYSTLDELPEGAQIVIPNDPSNMERCLLMLQDMGLVTLGEKTDTFYTILDVTENPKNIQFVEAEMTMTTRNIEDVDGAFAAAAVAQQAGLDATKYLYMDPGSVDYPVSLVVRAEDKDSEWATTAMQKVKTDEMKQKFNDQFKGAFALFE